MTGEQTEKPTQIELATPVQFLKGCGPERAAQLARLDVRIARDLLFLFPRDYQDLTDLRPISELEEDRLVSVFGTVAEIDVRSAGVGGSLLGVLIQQGASYLRAIWFNQPFMQKK